MSRTIVRPAIAQDLPEVIRICRDSPSAPQWGTDFFNSLLNPGEGKSLCRILHVVLLDDVVAGFAVVSAICSVYPADAELESIAVDPACRGRGAGRALLDACGAWSMEQGAASLRLEVRVSNETARRLYAGGGFVRVGVRPAYYSNPVEDAVLMERTFPASGERHLQTPSHPLA